MFEFKDNTLYKDGKPYTGIFGDISYDKGKALGVTQDAGQTTGNTQSADQALMQAILERFTAGSGEQDQVTTTTNVLKLTTAAAKALLTQAAEDAQFQGKLTNQQLQDFIQKFNTEANRQLETTVREVRQRVNAGTKPEDIKKIVENYVNTTTLSFFSPKELAKDYIWSLTNFKDEKTLGGKSLNALQEVRASVANNGVLDISEAEIQNAAKDIAMGKISIGDFNAKIRNRVVLNYPQFADRFTNNPNASARDIFDPYLSTMAKVLGIDKNSIKLDNPYLDRALRPDGAAGKLPAMAIADFVTFLKGTPDWEQGLEANELARDAAVGFGRAWGFGI